MNVCVSDMIRISLWVLIVRMCIGIMRYYDQTKDYLEELNIGKKECDFEVWLLYWKFHFFKQVVFFHHDLIAQF